MHTDGWTHARASAPLVAYSKAGRNAVLSGVVEWTEKNPNEMDVWIGLLLGNIDDECALLVLLALPTAPRDSILAVQAGAHNDELGPACRSLAARTRQAN
jgi:hypothetical protein